jgi:hypothetical protein
MLRSRSVRRSVAVTASVGVAAALTWLPAAPASAAVQAQYGAQGTASTSSSCTLSSGNDSPSSTISTFSHGKRSHSVDLNAGFTNTGDSSDTVEMTGHYSSSLTLAKKHGDLAKAVLSGSGSVAVHRALGSATACAPQAAVDAVSIASFTEGQPGWFLVDHQTVPKQGLAVIEVANSTSGNAVVFDIWQGGGSQTQGRGFVTPGTYSYEIAVGLTAGNFPPIFLKSAPRSSVSMEFHRAGSAPSGSTGSGKGFVEFPGSVNCFSHRATLRWKSSAGKVASGSFLVNGSHKTSDGTPRPGEKIVLKHLSSTADNTITAKLKLDGGGSATASRTYLPCMG